MNQSRSTCITVTLLFLAVSLAYGGFSVVRGSRSDPQAFSGSSDPTASVVPSAVSNGQSSRVESTTSAASPSLSTTEVKALDYQLQVIEDELDSLEVPADERDAAIEAGLD